MKKRNERKEVIRAIVRESSVQSQRDLVDRLKRKGYICTQATISRDITDMDLGRLPNGNYALPEDMRLHRTLTDQVVSVARANNLVVVKCSVGAGQTVGVAIDGAQLSGILGSIAGDDTILIICSNDKAAVALVAHLAKFRDS